SQPGGASPAGRDATTGRGGARLHARRRGPGRRGRECCRGAVRGQAHRRRGVDVRLRPGRAAARRRGLPARDRGGAALPRRPDPADRRGSDRGADRPHRETAGVRPVIGDVITRVLPWMSMGDEVSLHMDASPEEVWALVSDVTRTGEFSPATFEARWRRGSTGAEVGARFKGHVKRNGVGPTYWSACRVTACVPNEVFEFVVEVEAPLDGPGH